MEILKAQSNLLEAHKCEIDILKNNINHLNTCIYGLSQEIKEIKNHLGGGK